MTAYIGDTLHVPYKQRVAFVAWPYLCMIAFGLFWPTTGDHGFLQPKTLLFILALVVTCLHAVTRFQLPMSQVLLGLFVLASLLLLGIGFWISSPHLTSRELLSSIDQGKVFVVTMGGAWMVIYWFLDETVPYATLLKVMLTANLAYNVVKCVSVGAILLGLIDLTFVMDYGFATQTTSMGLGLSRLQTSTDIITPILIFFALTSVSLGVRLSPAFRWLYLLTASASLFISFSRYLWAIALIGYFFSFWVETAVTSFLKRLGCLLVVALLVIGFLGMESIQSVFYNRFLSSEVLDSDSTRVNQSEALLDRFLTHPYIGSGLGAFTDQNIRDVAKPHSYEVQWLAFLMQFGIVGLAIILFYALMIAMPFLNPPITRLKVCCLLMYCLWLFSGFTNPYLISLNSGIVYGLFFITGTHMNKKRLCLQP